MNSARQQIALAKCKRKEKTTYSKFEARATLLNTSD